MYSKKSKNCSNDTKRLYVSKIGRIGIEKIHFFCANTRIIKLLNNLLVYKYCCKIFYIC